MYGDADEDEREYHDSDEDEDDAVSSLLDMQGYPRNCHGNHLQELTRALKEVRLSDLLKQI